MTLSPFFSLFRGVFYAAVLVFFTVVLTSCSYKSDIRQGDEDLPEKLELLQRGMTKGEVEDLLGPRRAPEVFDSNVWIYYYRHRQGGFFPTTKTAGAILTFIDEYLTEIEFVGDAEFHGEIHQ